MPDRVNMPDRLPPQAVEAEMAVLGSMLINPEAVGRAIEVIGDEENFYSAGHRKIYRAMVTLFEKNQPADLVTVAEELRRLKWLDDAGGPVYLTQLSDSVATAANVEYYARIVLEKSVLRRLINSATQIVATAYDSEENAEVLLDQAEELIFAIKEKRLRKTLVPLKQFIHDSFATVQRFYDEKRHITGSETGYKSLDEMTSGFQPGELIILGARPSAGKTALALNIAQNLGVEQHQPVAIFSLEMSKDQLVLRLLCSEARVSSHRVRTGYLSQEEWAPLVNAAGLLHDAPIYIDDSAGASPLEIRTKARRLKAEVDIKLIVIDYLQLMRGSNSRVENRQQEIAEISRSLKALAKEVNVPVLALSQLSRGYEQRGENARPILSDLRESGAIEQDADVVLFLHRENRAAPGPDEGAMDAQPIELIVAKQRNGPIGSVKMVFRGSYTRFDERSDRDEPAGY